ncbi:HtrA2 peptidase [Methanohalobium evestigatum Z-7303]|uniref:HtrA2 peptidase n=1 Tax=Methanohalobium evestigatum (strain ATCC BAA-1072 / DSM 3721 / NBRC 107634 / OCM 161 / Z-7303) TaxID=644295 RepID=D7E7C9_METEZ|nr:trypsin-like peptidase domain-containing protein [Methanohalobium evestigatum]ADI73878.1 HtrA2 peptidase [Methanohalobium evestigatum Z-7303]
MVDNKEHNVRSRILIVATVFFIAGLLVGGVSLALSLNPDENQNQNQTQKNVHININKTINYSETYKELYNQVSDSVVSINIRESGLGSRISGQGSGFIYDSNRHILTNQHVIDGAENVEVVFSNGATQRANIVGSDKYSDIAVLRVDNIPEEENYSPSPLKLGNSSNIESGEFVMAIGNPFGLEGSITHGIVSATGRVLPTEEGFSIPNVIQTDAPLNPGNSGGPLLDLSGQIIGVNRAKSGDNVGFAIPANKARKVADSIIEKGEYEHAWIGISMVPVSYNAANYMDLNDTVSEGVMIVRVIDGGPAEKAGLEPGKQIVVNGEPTWVNGDIILGMDNREIRNSDQLITYLDTKLPGDRIKLKIYRNENIKTVNVTLQDRPDNLLR